MDVRMSLPVAGDLTWRVHETGSATPAVLFLHGFTGNGGYWFPVAEALRPRRCIMPDLPGHGATSAPLPAEAWGLDRAADALGALLDDMEVGRCDLVGYSMGGRIALHLALAASARISRLVLVGASPGLASAKERALRIASDEDLSTLLERDGIEAFVGRWEALPLFATQNALPEAARASMREARIGQDPRALAAALRAFGIGGQRPLHEDLGRLDIPVLLVAGGIDSKYCQIAEGMRERISGARVEIIEGCGHSVPLEKPGAFSRILEAFLSPLATEEEGSPR